MEDDLKKMEMEDDLNIFFQNYNYNLQKMEDDLKNNLKNGRQPQKKMKTISK